MLLTEIQLDQVAKVFGLTRAEPTLPVRDGVVSPETKVWWRCVEGPELVVAKDDWANIAKHPEAYQLEKPRIQTKYLD